MDDEGDEVGVVEIVGEVTIPPFLFDPVYVVFEGDGDGFCACVLGVGEGALEDSLCSGGGVHEVVVFEVDEGFGGVGEFEDFFQHEEEG